MRRKHRPSGIIDLSTVWRFTSSDWQAGEVKRIVPVVYQPDGVDTMCKVKVVRAADGTRWLVCPICGEECADLAPTKRGLGCGNCIAWLKDGEA
jgi:hypothetical protein